MDIDNNAPRVDELLTLLEPVSFEEMEANRRKRPEIIDIEEDDSEAERITDALADILNTVHPRQYEYILGKAIMHAWEEFYGWGTTSGVQVSISGVTESEPISDDEWHAMKGF